MRFEDSFLDDIKARVPISQVVGLRCQWDRKKTNTTRGDYWACCPLHGEKSPSFHCEDKKGRYHCFGCGASGGHFRFLMDIDGIAFSRAVEIVAELAGMRLPSSGPETEEEKREKEKRAVARAQAARRREESESRDQARRTETAGGIWKASLPLKGSTAAAYLGWRGLEVPEAEPEIRFHPSLPYSAAGKHPALVARVSGADGRGVAVWRIFLHSAGEGKALVDNAKLGFGPAAGGAIRLGGLAPKIGIAEGVETALAIRELGTRFPVWSCMSTSGIIGFEIPEGVKEIVVFPDGDSGKIKERQRGNGQIFISEPAGMAAAERFKAAHPDRRISIAEPPYDDDWLSVLQRAKGVPVR